MTDSAISVADPLAWWQDKQVAVVVGASVVRGWVLTASSLQPSAADEARIGQLTIVLFIGSDQLAQQFPSEVTVAVHAGGPHGRPHRVLGVWAENDLTDVRPHHASSRTPFEQHRSTRAGQQLTHT